MGTTTSGIWFPEKGTLVSPMETNFSVLASSVQDAFDAIYPLRVLNTEAEIKALREGTPFYVKAWKLSGVKTAAENTNGYKLNYTGTNVNTYNFNGFSGGGLVPGAADILISAPKIDNYSIPYKVKCELTLVLRTTANCAGYIYIRALNGKARDIRWHNYNNSGLYTVTGSIDVDVLPGPAEFFIVGNSDPLSQTTTEVLNISLALTISV